MTEVKVGTQIYTPRFCTVQIKEIFANKAEAQRNGYTEPTYWEDPEYGCLGKSLNMYHMDFCAYKK
jgi:hypothetical protein